MAARLRLRVSRRLSALRAAKEWLSNVKLGHKFRSKKTRCNFSGSFPPPRRHLTPITQQRRSKPWESTHTVSTPVSGSDITGTGGSVWGPFSRFLKHRGAFESAADWTRSIRRSRYICCCQLDVWLLLLWTSTIKGQTVASHTMQTSDRSEPRMIPLVLNNKEECTYF